MPLLGRRGLIFKVSSALASSPLGTQASTSSYSTNRVRRDTWRLLLPTLTPQPPTYDPAGALPDALSRQTPSTWKDAWLPTATPTAPEPTSRDTEAAFPSVLPAGEKPEEGEPVLHAEAEPGLTALDKEKEVTTARPRETTQLPITQRASTAKVTTAQAAVTSHPHGDVQPGLRETSVPTAPGQPDHQPPSVEDGGTSVIKEVAEDGTTNQLPAGEGSGEQVSVALDFLGFPGWPLVLGTWLPNVLLL